MAHRLRGYYYAIQKKQADCVNDVCVCEQQVADIKFELAGML